MNRRMSTLLLCSLCLTTLGACSKNADTDSVQENGLEISGPKSGVYSLFSVIDAIENMKARPSAMLGSYISVFLTQEVLLKVQGALAGVDAQIKLERADSSIEYDETFALLQEYGAILQVNIIDTLNRSPNRRESLDAYAKTLGSMNHRIGAKQVELESKLEDLEDLRRDQRRVVRDIERNIKNAERSNDFAALSTQQKLLASAKGTLAATEVKGKSTKQVLKAYEDLLEVGEERHEAIVKNSPILVIGLQVVDVPGIEGLNLVIEE